MSDTNFFNKFRYNNFINNQENFLVDDLVLLMINFFGETIGMTGMEKDLIMYMVYLIGIFFQLKNHMTYRFLERFPLLERLLNLL